MNVKAEFSFKRFALNDINTDDVYKVCISTKGISIEMTNTAIMCTCVGEDRNYQFNIDTKDYDTTKKEVGELTSVKLVNHYIGNLLEKYLDVVFYHNDGTTLSMMYPWRSIAPRINDSVVPAVAPWDAIMSLKDTAVIDNPLAIFEEVNGRCKIYIFSDKILITEYTRVDAANIGFLARSGRTLKLDKSNEYSEYEIQDMFDELSYDSEGFISYPDCALYSLDAVNDAVFIILKRWQ